MNAQGHADDAEHARSDRQQALGAQPSRSAGVVEPLKLPRPCPAAAAHAEGAPAAHAASSSVSCDSTISR